MNERPYLHFYSDCPYFAGCENMLVNFLGCDRLTGRFEVRFSYRQSEAYDRGLAERMPGRAEVQPLRLLDEGRLIEIVARHSRWAGALLRILARVLLLRYWFVLVNTLVLYRRFGPRVPDIVHINNGNYPGAYSCMSAAFAARLRGVRNIVYVVNNVALPYTTWRRRLDYLLDCIVSRVVSVFITASRFAGGELRRVLRLPAAQVANLHNGIAPRAVTESRDETLARLGIDGTRPLAAVVAVLEERKGHMVLLEALRRLKAQGASTPLTIVEGDGAQRAHIERFVLAHGLAGDVRLVGRERNVFNLLNAVDMVVLPSVSHEDFPNVVLEAMSLAKPVIGTRIAGIPEQIEDMETGILVRPGDADELAQALQRLECSADLRQRLGRNGLLRFREEFTAEKAVDRYIALYGSLLAS